MAKLYLGSTLLDCVAFGSNIIQLKNGVKLTMSGSPTSLATSFFYSCPFITNLVLPNTIKTIEQSACYQCKNLKTITLPSALTTIKSQAFAGCNTLNDVTIPANVTTIEDLAFGPDTDTTTTFTFTINSSKIKFTNNSQAVWSNYKNLVLKFAGNPPTFSGSYYTFWVATSFTVYYKSDNTNWTTTVKNNFKSKTLGVSSITWKTW